MAASIQYWCSNRRISFPVSTFQTTSVQSLLPVRKNLPSPRTQPYSRSNRSSETRAAICHWMDPKGSLARSLPSARSDQGARTQRSRSCCQRWTQSARAVCRLRRPTGIIFASGGQQSRFLSRSQRSLPCPGTVSNRLSCWPPTVSNRTAVLPPPVNTDWPSEENSTATTLPN